MTPGEVELLRRQIDQAPISALRPLVHQYLLLLCDCECEPMSDIRGCGWNGENSICQLDGLPCQPELCTRLKTVHRWEDIETEFSSGSDEDAKSWTGRRT